MAMRFSWKLGRVAGIDLYLHFTFLLMLVFFGLSQGGVAAVLFISALFGCVLLHELGHALMARRFGIPTEDITLYPIGGVARLARLPKAPGAELLIALAGPAVNVLIAGGLWVLGGLTGGTIPMVSELIGLNLVLAGFNLLPIFPMDGGRVLRALLSGALGRLRATEIAAALGQTLAVLFGLYCLFQGLLPQLFLAGFVYLAGASELRHVREEEYRKRLNRLDLPQQAPPGYLWIDRGNGVWQLCPVGVHDDGLDLGPRGAYPWR